MCICINCKYILICDTYKTIEKQHKNVQLINKNIFFPQNTIIDANLQYYNKENEIDWDIVECLSFIEKPGYWSSLNKKI